MFVVETIIHLILPYFQMETTQKYIKKQAKNQKHSLGAKAMFFCFFLRGFFR